jgi:hypothetical protein
MGRTSSQKLITSNKKDNPDPSFLLKKGESLIGLRKVAVGVYATDRSPRPESRVLVRKLRVNLPVRNASE